ncbi:2-polyprenyl-6-methoxyphenol hydroxylase-like FAD-dependent oxidoreductase [Actinoplanes campanulatus]|uniref:2-polyprenyl-6-methoxyphenol hydroxylase-like FAD-dependent oxidoreductase n=1 Tax=Actinoplanes campanulatus TaxID=113559 RepID=A0A7W5AFK8_9ACTN|nr:FAD-dependent monooxygenase [Actinoplanes campanulatus]MBB3095416.1 2-polyprenyl-6-methoxyphenol hydroxylase-like FAD-dependent oxidoreductase [Actinoplanes campanulatus]GGN41972.1 FAD-dependent oxidoreductase [Actinoplanes campanulatus]GID35019.1 FAD-dependent oxidoreductase [Actinoplanes campanulatus]
MPAVRNVLVVGGGAAGAAAAILLAEGGVTVDLVDLKPDVAALGSGITLQGNALRVLRRLGVWEQVEAEGYAFDTLGLRAPDPAGTLIAELTDIRTGGADLPATLGMYRPTLARILIDRATAAGARIRFGACPAGLTLDGEVTFADGERQRYDLVIGADGLRSWTRRQVGIDVEPQPVGMGIWRTFTKRPASVTRTDLYYGGPAYIAGYCPTGPDSIYAYLVEDVQDRFSLSPEEALAAMRELAGAYHGPWDEIRRTLTDPARVNYTAFESHVIDGPWHRGNVVLIGDAAHSCPPTLAQGAAQALEDAAVLAELLLREDALTDDLWQEFTGRRLGRARTVVEASLQLARWQLAHERGDVPGLMARVAHLVADPA